MPSKELTLPKDLQKQLAEQASAEHEREPEQSATIISTRGKKFRLGELVLPEELLVVIAASAHENAWYDRPYDANNTTAPACFAIAGLQENLEPHETSPTPQHMGCHMCPHNEWDTGPNGKGKACKNARRLVLLAYSDDSDSDETLRNTEPAMLKVPPTSIKGWASYSRSITGRYKRPTSSVVTRISLNPAVDYPQLVFELDSILEDPEDIRAVLVRQETTDEMVMRPYNVSEFKPAEKPKEKKKRRSKMS